MDPLPLAVCLLWSYRTRDFHPLDYTHAGRPPLPAYAGLPAQGSISLISQSPSAPYEISSFATPEGEARYPPWLSLRGSSEHDLEEQSDAQIIVSRFSVRKSWRRRRDLNSQTSNLNSKKPAAAAAGFITGRFLFFLSVLPAGSACFSYGWYGPSPSCAGLSIQGWSPESRST